MTEKKKILITVGRSAITLDLARQLHAAGHEIYITETSRLHMCCFSNAVKKTFVVPSPRFSPGEFIDELVNIVKRENIDFLIPNWEEILNISMHLDKFPAHCEVFCSPFKLLHTLHNKWLFMQRLEALGLPTPKTRLIKTLDDLEEQSFDTSYILKPCYSRASQRIRKVAIHQPTPIIDIEPHNPWIAQEWLEGKKFCTYSVCRNGNINAHAVYPVEYAIDGNSCLTFRHVDHKKIFDWIEFFVKSQNFTGQIAFDFIETPDGTLYAIECNPRSTSGLHLFAKEDHLERAFFGNLPEPIFPQSGGSKQIAAGMLFYGWKTLPENTGKRNYVLTLLKNKDVVFDWSDLKPFFSQPLLGLKYWFRSMQLRSKLHSTFYHDVDWNGESKPVAAPTEERLVPAEESLVKEL